MPHVKIVVGALLSGLAGAALISLASPAGAGGVTSVYSSIAARDCRRISAFKIDGDDYASEHACPGKAGLVVLKNENDLRETVSVARSAAAAARQPAAAQGFGPFNSTSDTAEWRIGQDGKPFAMIQRWHIADNDDPGKDFRPRTKPMLVVTRLPPGTVCHVAYVDVQANAQANDVARQAADAHARGFDCSKDQIIIAGSRGRATELAGR